jgi:small subunit ribosomal protein S8
MFNDSIADCLTRIRNAQSRRKGEVKIPMSKLVWNVLEVMKREGFVSGVEKIEKEGQFPQIRVGLKYYPDGAPMIGSCQRRSKSGRRLYVRAGEVTKVKAGLGISVVSTSQGVMSDREARKLGIGGELLAEVS